MLLLWPLLLFRSLRAARIASRLGAPGMLFAKFGRLVGIRAIVAGDWSGFGLLLTPVNIVRYWEFPFAWSAFPMQPGAACLDVASPRLFSLYVASTRSPRAITIINPDVADAAHTERLARTLGLASISVRRARVQDFLVDGDRYDVIWAISVIEHIPIDGDIDAVIRMYESLTPGGRLILTVPVDRRHWDELRHDDPYGLNADGHQTAHFFQRWYDSASIQDRLVANAAPDAYRLSWFGERVAGRFADYERDWQARGYERTVEDPLEVARWYTSFDSWANMPGRGVCGLVMEKAT
jgi:predicted SAM-dependent methyltransferase